MKFFTVAFMFMFLGLVNISVCYADEATLFTKYSKGCEDKNAESCYKLGFMYASGDGVEQDNKKAKKLYKKACDGGNAEGCISLEMLKSADKLFKTFGN